MLSQAPKPILVLILSIAFASAGANAAEDNAANAEVSALLDRALAELEAADDPIAKHGAFEFIARLSSQLQSREKSREVFKRAAEHVEAELDLDPKQYNSKGNLALGDLVAIQSEAGDIEGALETASYFNNVFTRMLVNVGIASEAFKHDQIEKANEVLQLHPDPELRMRAEVHAVGAYARTAGIDAAVRFAEQHLDDRSRSEGLYLLCTELAKAGRFQDAKDVAARSTAGRARPLRLLEIAPQEWKAGEQEAARKTFAEAVELNRALAAQMDPDMPPLEPMYIATAQAGIGEFDAAVETIRSAEDVKAQELIKILLLAGRPKEALEHVPRIENDFGKGSRLAEIARGFVKADQSADALAMLNDVDPAYRCDLLLDIARSERSKGRDDLARKALDSAAELAREPPPAGGMFNLRSLARVYADAGLVDEARLAFRESLEQAKQSQQPEFRTRLYAEVIAVRTSAIGADLEAQLEAAGEPLLRAAVLAGTAWGLPGRASRKADTAP